MCWQYQTTLHYCFPALYRHLYSFTVFVIYMFIFAVLFFRFLFYVIKDRICYFNFLFSSVHCIVWVCQEFVCNSFGVINLGWLGTQYSVYSAVHLLVYCVPVCTSMELNNNKICINLNYHYSTNKINKSNMFLIPTELSKYCDWMRPQLKICFCNCVFKICLYPFYWWLLCITEDTIWWKLRQNVCLGKKSV